MDPPESWLSPRFPAKPSINFGNGMYIGFGLACFIFGSFIAFSLNSYYWSQTDRLINSGLAPSDTHFELFDIANMISMGTYLALAGVYALVYGSLNQYSPSLRLALERKDREARYGTRLLTVGILLTAYFSLFFMQQLYSTSQSWIATFYIGAILSCLLLVAIGITLLASFYSKSRKSATKV
jgi:MFS family permease